MKHRLSMRQLLFVLVGAIALPLLIARAVAVYMDARADEAQAGMSALNLAQLAASNTNQVISDTKGILEGLMNATARARGRLSSRRAERTDLATTRFF